MSGRMKGDEGRRVGPLERIMSSSSSVRTQRQGLGHPMWPTSRRDQEVWCRLSRQSCGHVATWHADSRCSDEEMR